MTTIDRPGAPEEGEGEDEKKADDATESDFDDLVIEVDESELESALPVTN